MSSIDFSDPETIAFLTDALTAAGVDGIEISGAKGQLRIVVSGDGAGRVARGGAATSAPVAPITVRSPIAGRFLPSHPAGSGTAADLPRDVRSADVLGFAAVGPVLVPVTAGRDGVLKRRLVEPDTLVGFGAALFEIEPLS